MPVDLGAVDAEDAGDDRRGPPKSVAICGRCRRTGATLASLASRSSGSRHANLPRRESQKAGFLQDPVPVLHAVEHASGHRDGARGDLRRLLGLHVRRADVCVGEVPNQLTVVVLPRSASSLPLLAGSITFSELRRIPSPVELLAQDRRLRPVVAIPRRHLSIGENRNQPFGPVQPARSMSLQRHPSSRKPPKCPSDTPPTDDVACGRFASGPSDGIGTSDVAS